MLRDVSQIVFSRLSVDEFTFDEDVDYDKLKEIVNEAISSVKSQIKIRIGAREEEPIVSTKSYVHPNSEKLFMASSLNSFYD